MISVRTRTSRDHLLTLFLTSSSIGERRSASVPLVPQLVQTEINRYLAHLTMLYSCNFLDSDDLNTPLGREPIHLHLADAFIQSDLHMCDLQCIHILH